MHSVLCWIEKLMYVTEFTQPSSKVSCDMGQKYYEYLYALWHCTTD